MFVILLVYWHLVYSIKVRLTMLNQKLREIQNGGKITVQFHDLTKAYENLSECRNTVIDCYGLVILVINQKSISNMLICLFKFILLGCLIHFLVTLFMVYAAVLTTSKVRVLVGQATWFGVHLTRLMLMVGPS